MQRWKPASSRPHEQPTPCAGTSGKASFAAKIAMGHAPKKNCCAGGESIREWMYTIAEAASQVSSALYFGRSERLNYHSASEEPLCGRGKCVICDAGYHKVQTCPNFSAINTACALIASTSTEASAFQGRYAT